jgi:hypothetical protein
MNALAVRLLLLIKKGVLVPWQHLLLSRHFLVPSLNCFCGLAVSAKGCAKGVNYAVNRAQALALAGFLGLRDAPWDFPMREWILELTIVVFKPRGGRVFNGGAPRPGWENLGMCRHPVRKRTREDPRIMVMRA